MLAGGASRLGDPAEQVTTVGVSVKFADQTAGAEWQQAWVWALPLGLELVLPSVWA
jgi:hypothetical protein